MAAYLSHTFGTFQSHSYMSQRIARQLLRPCCPLGNTLARRRQICRVSARVHSTTSQRFSPRRIYRSSVNWTTIVIYFAIGASTGVTIGIFKAIISAPTQDTARADDIDVIVEDMATQLPRGRPGTLTPDEEARLRELWNLTLQVTGVISQAPPPSSNGESAELSGSSSASATPEMKKKSRLSFMKKKKNKHDDKENHVPSTSVPASVAEIADHVGGSDDKHGLGATFRSALNELPPERVGEALWSMVKHDHPDALLLRFLRARKWDVNAALVMMISALHWRLVEAKVDSDIMVNGEAGMVRWSEGTGAHAKEGADFMSQIRMGKSFLHGRDKEGRPICYVRVRLHKPGQECEEAIERFTVYTIETARMFLRPPVDTATVVFDMTDFGMANMDYAPVKFMIKCFEANYPESLGVVLVHNAPWIFNTVWKIIKGWLDPVVASKIHFTNNLKDVEGFIEKSQIIKELGGPMDWHYEYQEPTADENAAMQDEATRRKLEQERAGLSKEYESIVQDWIAHKAEADTLRRQRDEIAAKLRQNYWKLDPYVRARSVYDRLGELHGEQPSTVAKPAASTFLQPKPSNENSPRPSVDSVAQSFHTARMNWEGDVD